MATEEEKENNKKNPYGEGLGTGGKFRKRPFRRTQTTPYDRPATPSETLQPPLKEIMKDGSTSLSAIPHNASSFKAPTLSSPLSSANAFPHLLLLLLPLPILLLTLPPLKTQKQNRYCGIIIKKLHLLETIHLASNM
ncbi:uncharacterized protein [Arachis hypogaea]|uniref:uncharacterized protein n=1 Tax=Arachis hypogaea TaxID=3818 RepID=UPI003B20F8B7